MDFINKLKGSDNDESSNSEQHQRQGEESSGGSGLMGKINNALGGGQKGEQNEDLIDKAVDWAQERMGQGPQNNESAIEQAKDEQISDAIRRGYKSVTGSDIPIKDKS